MSAPRVGGLFAGYGGLELALHDVLGAEPAWFSEFDKAPSAILAHRWPGVPNLGDITRIDWSAVEPVDIIAGGSPCQDMSTAGNRAGMRAGTRSGLWASMCDAIEIIRPRLVVWENVRGALGAEADSAMEQCPGCVGDPDDGPVLRALGRVLGDLADLGYDASWCGLRAADVGAPHGRFRIFVFANPKGDPWRISNGDNGFAGITANVGHERAGSPRGRRDGSADSGQPPADANDAGLEGRTDARERGATDDGPGRRRQVGPVLGGDVDWGQYAPAIHRWEHVLGRRAPAPTEPGPKGGQRLSPAFVEWLMGLPDGWVTDVGISRNDQLKALGNGVVPQQAAAAIRHLLGVREYALTNGARP